MSNKEVKFDANIDVKRFADQEGKWIIEGIATTADLDVDGLYISEEALIGAEDDLKKYTTLLYNHDRDKEIGKIIDVKYMPEQRALWIKCLISKTVPDIWQKVNEGVLSKFSISGTALDFTEKFIKGLDKVVQYVNQMKIFETSLVTIPADASARTLAFYVEKSMKEFSEENSMANKAKTKEKKIEKSQEETIDRDAKQLEILVTSVEDALSSDADGVKVDTLRSVLDFLKALEATSPDITEDVSKSSVSIDDITKAINDSIGNLIGEIKETVTALSEVVVDVSKSKVADESKKEDISKSVDENKYEKKEDETKEISKSVDEDKEILEIRKSLSDLKSMISNNLPIRKGVGFDEHKEDERDVEKNLSEKEKFLRSDKYKEAAPGDKLGMLMDFNASQVK
jgi:phage head maturation protease